MSKTIEDLMRLVPALVKLYPKVKSCWFEGLNSMLRTSTHSIAYHSHEIGMKIPFKNGQLALKASFSNDEVCWYERYLVSDTHNLNYPLQCVEKNDESDYFQGNSFDVESFYYMKAIPEKKTRIFTFEELIEVKLFRIADNHCPLEGYNTMDKTIKVDGAWYDAKALCETFTEKDGKAFRKDVE